jgi:hypothetical protein
MYAGGPPVYFACGTPASWIRFRVRRPVSALVVEIAIAAAFSTFAAYAFSGAGTISPLPLLPYALVVIALIYLARGMLILPQAFGKCVYTKRRRDILYSATSAVLGGCCAFATYNTWTQLVQRASMQ